MCKNKESTPNKCACLWMTIKILGCKLKWLLSFFGWQLIDETLTWKQEQSVWWLGALTKRVSCDWSVLGSIPRAWFFIHMCVIYPQYHSFFWHLIIFNKNSRLHKFPSAQYFSKTNISLGFLFLFSAYPRWQFWWWLCKSKMPISHFPASKKILAVLFSVLPTVFLPPLL